MNWITDSQITHQDNRQFAINIVNWLTSNDAKVLLSHNIVYNHKTIPLINNFIPIPSRIEHLDWKLGI